MQKCSLYNNMIWAQIQLKDWVLSKKQLVGLMHLEVQTGFVSHSCSQLGQPARASARCSADHIPLPSPAFAASQVSPQLRDFYFCHRSQASPWEASRLVGGAASKHTLEQHSSSQLSGKALVRSVWRGMNNRHLIRSNIHCTVKRHN